MKKGYNIWKAINRGDVWIVDGERGRVSYPGSLTLAAVMEYYAQGIDWGTEEFERRQGK